MSARALAHWALLAVAVVSWGLSLRWSSSSGASSLVAVGWVFFASCVALAVLERLRDRLPWGSPRAFAWLLVALTASFLPSIAISGAWRGDSLLMLPAVLGTWLAPFGTPWLIATGPQPAWRDGRAAPALLAWMGLALNGWLSSYG